MQDASIGGQNQQNIFTDEIKQRMAPGRATQYRSLGSFLEGLLQHGISVSIPQPPLEPSLAESWLSMCLKISYTRFIYSKNLHYQRLHRRACILFNEVTAQNHLATVAADAASSAGFCMQAGCCMVRTNSGDDLVHIPSKSHTPRQPASSARDTSGCNPVASGCLGELGLPEREGYTPLQEVTVDAPAASASQEAAVFECR